MIDDDSRSSKYWVCAQQPDKTLQDTVSTMKIRGLRFNRVSSRLLSISATMIVMVAAFPLITALVATRSTLQADARSRLPKNSRVII